MRNKQRPFRAGQWRLCERLLGLWWRSAEGLRHFVFLTPQFPPSSYSSFHELIGNATSPRTGQTTSPKQSLVWWLMTVLFHLGENFNCNRNTWKRKLTVSTGASFFLLICTFSCQIKSCRLRWTRGWGSAGPDLVWTPEHHRIWMPSELQEEKAPNGETSLLHWCSWCVMRWRRLAEVKSWACSSSDVSPETWTSRDLDQRGCAHQLLLMATTTVLPHTDYYMYEDVFQPLWDKPAWRVAVYQTKSSSIHIICHLITFLCQIKYKPPLEGARNRAASTALSWVTDQLFTSLLWLKPATWTAAEH